jgi:5'-deoxynucleotidase YfbR-like HD superfamily hydrolase
MANREIYLKNISNSDFVSQEIEKLLVYYQLKHTLRWNDDSSIVDEKESVAEHTYGMYVLCDYFLPLQERPLNETVVKRLILWHDMSEALVDDMTTLSKTDEHRQQEKVAEQTLADTAPQHMQESIGDSFTIYNAQESPEAQFVKALDKLEPLFHIRFQSTKINSQAKPEALILTAAVMDKYQQNRLQYIEKYPEILAFSKVLSQEIKKSNYIHPEA